MSSQVSNPFSTGGGGQFFEAKVQASFLLHLLISGRVPCLPNGNVQSVRLQARQAGFHTDDAVVRIRTEIGTEYCLLAQVKHHVAIALGDGEFCDALGNAWADFNNQSAFVHGRDALALITGPLSAQTLQDVRPLLDWARTSASGAEFVGKVATAQFSSKNKRDYLQVFRSVLTKVAGATLTDHILWQFLKHLYLLSYDFDVVEGSVQEAAILTMLDMARSPSSSLDTQAVWEGLIVQAQEWNKTAGTFTAADLPDRLRSAVQPHRSMAQREAVARLREHCGFIFGTINTELAAGIRIPRTAALDELANAVESAHIVVVQGAPGSGKSAIVKSFLEALPNGITPFSFKAQEFNQPHIHQFLASMGIQLRMEQIRCEFALMPRKVLLIDGAERLFELSSHEAFRHLLQELSGDKSWTVVITCRESSAQHLREHLLAQWGATVVTITIPPLSQEELRWVSNQVPQLSPLIANQRLVRLLRLPFILSLAWKAFPASASTAVASDIDERQFKDIVWRDYVERAAQRQDGLPIKRSKCLLSVSVERARRMSLFVSPEGLDADSLKALIDDEILIKSNAGGFAPAHDVLEDWAVSRFIAQKFQARGGNPAEFLNAVGTEPAMRRGFRLWLSEALETPGSQQVMDFVLSIFQPVDVPAVWRDEIAVAVLQSENAGTFIMKVEQLLLDDNKTFYRRLVHVLRTACKGPNESLLRIYGLAAFRNHLALGSVFVIPVGSGWRELILFTHRNLASFNLEDANTVLGLLKDWAQGLGPSDPLPVEAKFVSQISQKYWALLTAPMLYARDLDKEFLRLLFKIPHAASGEVEALIRSALANTASGYHARIVLEHVTKSIECQPLCAYLPHIVIEVAEKTWRLPAGRHSQDYSHGDLEEFFGFEHSVRFNYYPQSALQGPFLFLLISYPDVAVDFIVRLANQAALSYSQSRLGNEASSVQLSTDTGTRKLIASARLWALYRGMMPGPQVLECALMSLEAWLLGQAKQGNDIREVFRKILDTSSSAATIAVLTSVALAYPGAIENEVLPLLGVREFYQWDFERSHQEQSYVSSISSLSMLDVPTDVIKKTYYQERKDSDALPHRKTNLEELAFRLQWTPLRDRVWAILDQFHAALPTEERQSKDEIMWRIALHRMDARHFKAEEGKESGQIILTPGEPAADLQQHIAKVEEDFTPVRRRMQLARWGMTKFNREPQSTDSFPDWRDALREAKALCDQHLPKNDESSLGVSGPAFVAAFLVRDHNIELGPDDSEWCRQKIIEEVLNKDGEKTFETRIAKNPFDGSRPCACVLPLLLRGAVDALTRSQVEECIAVAVTHTSEEVRDYAAQGIRSWLWEIDVELAKACVAGLYELARDESQIRRTQRGQENFSPQDKEREVMAAIVNLRGRIVKRDSIAALKAPAVDLQTHDWPELLDAVSMLKPDLTDSDLRTFVMANLDALLREAEAAEAWRSDRQASYEFQDDFARWFARFALARPAEEAASIGELLCDYVERCPKYLGVLLEALPYEEDRVRSGAIFWSIWQGVSPRIFEHPLLRGSSRIWRYEELHKLVRILLFADLKWKDGVEEWAPLTANRDFLDHTAAVVGNTKAGFGALLSVLNSVGRVFLPDAITLLSHALEKPEGGDLFEDLNATFDLEVLLRKVCYEHGTSIRQRPEQHRAALRLLDQLVERGSHTGFRLRDYIVAPLPADR